MDLMPFIDAVRRDLLQAAALGDDATRRTAAALASSIEPSVRLALMNSLAQMAAEITGELQSTGPQGDSEIGVDVRLDGSEVRVSISRHTAQHLHDTPGADASTEEQLGWGQAMKDAGSELSRTTVRLFQDLKNQAETAATDQGVSLNTYISRAVADSVRGSDKDGRKTRGAERPGHGKQSSGWIRS